MNELKACPFCKCEVEVFNPTLIRHPENKCALSGDFFSYDQWNTRTPDPRMKEAVRMIRGRMNELKCPDCGANEIHRRCAVCGCQWERTPDPRLKEFLQSVEDTLVNKSWHIEALKFRKLFYEKFAEHFPELNDVS